MTNTTMRDLLFGVQYGTDGGHLDPIWAQLREQRIGGGLTIAQLAAKSGVAGSTISRAERGYHCWLDVTRKVAAALDMDLTLTLAEVTS